MMVLLIVLSLLSMVICYEVARRRKADRRYWLLAGLLFGPFAIPFVFMAKPDRKRTQSQ